MCAMRMKTTVKLRAMGETTSHARTDIKIRDLDFVIDEPTERGGTNLGPTPTDTALAALIGCTNVIGSKCADKMGIDAGDMSVTCVCDFDRRGVTLEEEIDVPFQSIELTVKCHGSARQDDLDRLAVEVAKYCPLSKLFEQAGTQINTTWHPA
ncbi:MAG: OsmC family protein [Rhodobacteraceae bacterium]|nr:OsmC family protein [Paracoccaceae bacterium]